MNTDAYNDYLCNQIEMHKNLASTYVDKRYGPDFSRIYQAHWNARMCQIGGLEPGAKVLDLGAGTGIFVPTLVNNGYRVTELDLSHAMLGAGRDIYGSLSVDWICADGGCIPVPAGTFDAVFCRGVLHHLPDLSIGLQEISRVLRNDGLLVFSEPSDDSAINRLARRFIYSRNREFCEKDEGFRRREIIALLDAAGFDVEYSRGFGFFGYVFAGFPDKLSILERMPGNKRFVRLFILVDNVLEMLPYVHTLALHWQVGARKR